MNLNEVQALVARIENEIARGARKLSKDEEKLLAQAKASLVNKPTRKPLPKTAANQMGIPMSMRDFNEEFIEKHANGGYVVENVTMSTMIEESLSREKPPCIRTAKVQEMDRRLAKLLGGEILDKDGTPITVSIPNGRVN